MVPIRPAQCADVTALAELKLTTFRETFLDAGFGIPYPPADLALFEAESYSQQAIAREIVDPVRVNWVVEIDGRLVGYAQTGPCKLPHADALPDHGELYQLYVRREAQGLKLGIALLDRAIDHLATVRPGPIWLGVWSGNAKAQSVYRAKGFVKVGDYRFRVGSWYDEEHIFRRA